MIGLLWEMKLMKRWKSLLALLLGSMAAGAAMASTAYYCSRECAADYTKGSPEYAECYAICMQNGGAGN